VASAADSCVPAEAPRELNRGPLAPCSPSAEPALRGGLGEITGLRVSPPSRCRKTVPVRAADAYGGRGVDRPGGGFFVDRTRRASWINSGAEHW